MMANLCFIVVTPSSDYFMIMLFGSSAFIEQGSLGSMTLVTFVRNANLKATLITKIRPYLWS